MWLDCGPILLIRPRARSQRLAALSCQPRSPLLHAALPIRPTKQRRSRSMLPQFAADVETELMRVTGQPLRWLFWALRLAGWFHYVVVMFLTVASILLFRAAFMTKHPRGFGPIVCLVVACGCAVAALLTAYSAIYVNSYHRFVDEVHDAVKQGEMRTPTRGSLRPHGHETKDERVTDTAVSVEV